MSNSFTIPHLFWNMYFIKHVSGILSGEDPQFFSKPLMVLACHQAHILKTKMEALLSLKRH